MSAERHRRWALSWPCAVAAPAGRRAVWSGTFPPSRLPPRCSLPFPKISGASASRSLGPAPWRARLVAMRSVGPACAGGPGCAREGSHGSRGVRPPPAAARPLTRHLGAGPVLRGVGGARQPVDRPSCRDLPRRRPVCSPPCSGTRSPCWRSASPLCCGRGGAPPRGGPSRCCPGESARRGPARPLPAGRGQVLFCLNKSQV